MRRDNRPPILIGDDSEQHRASLAWAESCAQPPVLDLQHYDPLPAHVTQPTPEQGTHAWGEASRRIEQDHLENQL